MYLKKIKVAIFIVVSVLMILGVCNSSFAERDWEYWSQENFSVSINKNISYLIIPEWRFKNDMHDSYLFKLETGPSFKINKYLEITPYYVYQEKKSGNLWDRSDLTYLDGTVKFTLKELFELKLSNRFRYQYDFDKAKATLRNTLKIAKDIKIVKLIITPYISEEPFYDTKLDRITEHRSTIGITFNLLKNISLAAGYMLDSKKSKDKWTYANVLVTNLGIKF